MHDVMASSPAVGRRGGRMSQRFLDYLPRGNTLDAKAWRRRHRLLEWVLLLHVPGLVVLGMLLDHPLSSVALVVSPTIGCLVVGHLVTHRRWASFFITGGLVFCSVALVLITRGSIEAHFHFFIIIGFIALYQDWVPFLWNVAFTVLSHGVGTIWLGGQIFNHPAAQQHPWIWSFVHGIAVLFACAGMVIFWRITEDEQTEKESLGRQLITADAEITRRQFTSDMLVNLARRNQSMLYRQLDIINQLEDKERDPDALADLFKLDHLATRVRRNAESLLVLAGEQAPRTWSAPVALRDVVRAAIAETEDLDRVVFAVDDRVAVSGASVADLTHLLAELTENAVRFSAPETAVTIRARPNRRDEGGQLLTVEDWGVGMPRDDLAAANDLLAHPREVDLAVSQRLGFHVVSRLAARHGISVSLSATPGSGITALVVLPAALFASAALGEPKVPSPIAPPADGRRLHVRGGDGPGTPIAAVGDREAFVAPMDGGTAPGIPVVRNGDAWLPPEPFTAVPAGHGGPEGRWRGWWNPDVHGVEAGDATSAFAGAGDGAGPAGRNGNGANGHGGNGYGANGGNGHGTNGTNGHGANGTDGQGTNGQGANGRGANGTGTVSDGKDASVVLWSHTDDADEQPTILFGAGPDRTGDDRGARDGGAPPAGPTPRPVLPTRRASATSIPDARREPPARIEPRPALAADTAPSAHPTTPSERSVPAVPVQPRPVGAGPLGARGPALPRPRGDEPASPAPASASASASAIHPVPASSAGRGLRRRVPQSHLAPELRERNHGLAETAAPLSADAAASALSRYQASRQAAQAIAEVPHGPTDEGERR